MTDRLVDSGWLVDHLDDPTVHILEVGSQPDDRLYRRGHAPGAVWAYWKELCWHPTDREFATADEMAARLGVMGIADTDTIVLMSDKVQYGGYAYWVLNMSGHPDTRILDGSRTAWVIEGRPLTVDVPQPAPVRYRPGTHDQSSRVGRDEVRSQLHDPGTVLLDVRSPEEYQGLRVMPLPEFDHGAERTGRIPGARHLYYRLLLNDDDTFRTPEKISALLPALGVEGDREVVCYCRLSHRASLVWFALTELVGHPAARIYDGSWTEWGSIVGFPIER